MSTTTTCSNVDNHATTWYTAVHHTDANRRRRFKTGFDAEEGEPMAKIKVKCPEGHEMYMEDYERKACPKCGRVVVGPKAK